MTNTFQAEHLGEREFKLICLCKSKLKNPWCLPLMEHNDKAIPYLPATQKLSFFRFWLLVWKSQLHNEYWALWEGITNHLELWQLSISFFFFPFFSTFISKPFIFQTENLEGTIHHTQHKCFANVLLFLQCILKNQIICLKLFFH